MVDLQCQRGPAKREREGEGGGRDKGEGVRGERCVCREWKQSPEVFLKSDPRAEDFITELRNQYD